jgi:hypothetical protein
MPMASSCDIVERFRTDTISNCESGCAGGTPLFPVAGARAGSRRAWQPQHDGDEDRSHVRAQPNQAFGPWSGSIVPLMPPSLTVGLPEAKGGAAPDPRAYVSNAPLASSQG